MEYQLNWISLLGFIALSQATLMIGYLILFHRKRVEGWLSIALLISLMLALGHDLLLYTRIALNMPFIYGLAPVSTYLYGPLLYFIVVKLAHPDRGFKWLDSLHFLPFILHFILQSPVYFMAIDLKLAALQQFYEIFETADIAEYSTTDLRSLIAFYGHRVVYCVICARVLITTYKRIDPKQKAKIYCYQLLLSTILLYCTVLLFSQILKAFMDGSSLMNLLVIHSLGLAIVIILFSLLIYHFSFESMFNISKKYRHSPINRNISREILQRLDDLILTESLHQDVDLSLKSLVAKTGLSYHHVSQVINAELKINFNEFINNYRLEHFKKLLADEDYNQKEIIELAYQSGFNSKATFYRFFKMKTGMSPNHYKKSLSASRSNQ